MRPVSSARSRVSGTRETKGSAERRVRTHSAPPESQSKYACEPCRAGEPDLQKAIRSREARTPKYSGAPVLVGPGCDRRQRCPRYLYPARRSVPAVFVKLFALLQSHQPISDRRICNRFGSRRCTTYSLPVSRRTCVKTCTSEERAALFSLLSFPIAVVSVFIFQNDEIEKDFLRAV